MTFYYLLQLGIAGAFFLVFALWEKLGAWRRVAPLGKRRLSHAVILVIDAIVVAVIPLAPLSLAMVYATPPTWWNVLLTVVGMDLVIYWQHRIFHQLPFLWRFHRMHHTDPHLDLTTAWRFHPVEILLSLGIKLGVVSLFRPPVEGVLIFEILLYVLPMFNHANIRLPKRLEPILRAFLVTPAMHRVHHTRFAQEINSNFGFNFSFWDRLFGTYTKEPQEGSDKIVLGMGKERSAEDQRVVRLLGQPFRKIR